MKKKAMSREDLLECDQARDVLFGYLLSTPDLYARAALVRHLDTLHYWAKHDGNGHAPIAGQSRQPAEDSAAISEEKNA